MAVVFAGLSPGAGPDSTSSAFSPSKHVLYHFVRSAAYVGRQADALDQQDGSGKGLRTAFLSSVGISEGDGPSVFALVSALDTQFAALDSQAAQAIAKTKSQVVGGGVLRPPPAELAHLQQQKIALMNALSATLTQRLSKDATAAITGYLARTKGGTTVPGNQ